MQTIYTIGTYIFSFLIKLASPFNAKARLLKNGRKEIWNQLQNLDQDSSIFWVHCASLGEFEQGRPIIEAIRAKHPDKKILLTFFSPSGYEVRKNYDMAHWVTYLPADTPQNARRFLNAVKPACALFIKYEFWPCFFKALHQRDIPIYSISSIFRENQLFFKWYGGWFRKALKAVSKFFVQDEESGRLLNKIGIKNYQVVGDTRFDRVATIVKKAAEVPAAATFAKEASLVIVAGSTWPPDEDLLIKYINEAPSSVKMIIAPHEVHQSHINQIEQKLNVPSLRYSNLREQIPNNTKVLIIDTIGLLSAIYRYGDIAYIGGGFGKGIHNTLEAATYGIPVIFGPKYGKFKEACDLIDCSGGFPIQNFKDLYSLIEKFRNDTVQKKRSGKAAGNYVNSMCGSTEIILKEILPPSSVVEI
ncbi:3-deoxy-D-manno-octulosonic acid transferase [Thermophagus sp. OGC60D27]|uniref:3-deoxy-D-manno-octulosonic acid transferase n=1 Tax=Thermophagus sp. OGC60D27 TaxID=3458415 RepID=UPI004037E1FE